MSWSSLLKQNIPNADNPPVQFVKATPQKLISRLERVGFINSKNDCFFHVVLQLLLTVPKFNWDLNHAICKEIFKLRNEIYESQAPVFPSKLHELINNKFPQFLQMQQDVTECFYMIIDMLHEELKESTNHPVNGEEDWLEIGYKSKAIQKRLYSFHNSPMRCFYGQCCTAILKKNKISAKSIEPFLFLSVELFDSLATTMNKYSFSNFKNNENTWFESLPEVLTIQFLRFTYHKQRGLSKNKRMADYPNSLPVPCGSEGKATIYNYRLYGVIYHIGDTIECGHYTVALYDLKLGNWVYIDDEHVIKVSQQEVLKTRRDEAYMLMYVRQ